MYYVCLRPMYFIITGTKDTHAFAIPKLEHGSYYGCKEVHHEVNIRDTFANDRDKFANVFFAKYRTYNPTVMSVGGVGAKVILILK